MMCWWRFITEGDIQEAAEMSPILYVLHTYGARSKQKEIRLEKENRCPSSVRTCPSPQAATIKQKSERIAVTSKPDRIEEDGVTRLLREQHPYPSRVWTKTQLLGALIILAPKKKAGKFVNKVINPGNTGYKHHSGI